MVAFSRGITLSKLFAMDVVICFCQLSTSRTRMNYNTECDKGPSKKIRRMCRDRVATRYPLPVHP